MTKILIVEDNEMNMRLFSDLLKSQKYDVVSCSDGRLALETVQKEKPDLILMDIQYDGIKFKYDDYACNRFKRDLIDSLDNLQKKYAIRESMIKSLDDLL